MPDWLRFPVVLAVIAAIAGAGLAFVQGATKEEITRNKARKLDAAFESVEGYKSNRELELSAEQKAVFGSESRCFKLFGEGDTLIGCAAQVQCTDPQCYNNSDPIVVVVVLDAEMKKVKVVRTTANNETPGLGTQASDKNPTRSLASMAGAEPAPEPESEYKFLDQFAGLQAGSLALKKEGGTLDAITGATVSSKAVVGGVNKACSLIGQVLGKKD